MPVDPALRGLAEEHIKLVDGRAELPPGLRTALLQFEQAGEVTLRLGISDEEISRVVPKHPVLSWNKDGTSVRFLGSLVGLLTNLRDGHRCVYCGDEAKEGDHLRLRKDGGRWRVDNIVSCCTQCNATRGQKQLQQWLDILKSGEYAATLDARAVAWQTHDPDIAGRYRRRADEIRRRVGSGFYEYDTFLRSVLGSSAGALDGDG